MQIRSSVSGSHNFCRNFDFGRSILVLVLEGEKNNIIQIQRAAKEIVQQVREP